METIHFLYFSKISIVRSVTIQHSWNILSNSIESNCLPFVHINWFRSKSIGYHIKQWEWSRPIFSIPVKYNGFIKCMQRFDIATTLKLQKYLHVNLEMQHSLCWYILLLQQPNPNTSTTQRPSEHKISNLNLSHTYICLPHRCCRWTGKTTV